MEESTRKTIGRREFLGAGAAGGGSGLRPQALQLAFQLLDFLRGGQRIGMVRSQHTLQVEQESLQQRQSLPAVPSFTRPGSDVAPGGQRVGMVRSQHLLQIGQESLQQRQSLPAVPGRSCTESKLCTRG